MAEGGEPSQVKGSTTDEPLGPTGVVNTHQAAHHQRLIKDTLEDFQRRIEEGHIKYVFKQLIEEMRSIISRVHKPINQADKLAILWATPDPSCTALKEATEESERYLEDIMLDEVIPPGEKVAAEVSQVKPITYDQKDMLVSLFDDSSIAHERLSRAAGTMSSLCKVMIPEQLMLIMKGSVWLMIQLNATPGLFNPPAQMGKKELPDDKSEQIKDTMIPRPERDDLHKQPDYSPTRLLAATLAYYIHKHFIQGMTMVELQKRYVVKPKTLALCITGKKYLGGTDMKAQEKRKCRASGKEPSTSAQ